jgi:ABC-type dipeptide/oligopeptide/nickel transport systems, permease components
LHFYFCLQTKIKAAAIAAEKRKNKGVENMARYVVKRLILAVVTIFIVCAITFFAMNAIPGGPFNAEKAPSPEVQKVLEKRYNLDKPVGTQFVLYMRNVFRGDFGVSLKTGRDIADILWTSFKISAKLGGMAAVVAIICGIVLGSIAALMRNKWPDRVIIFFSTLATATPSFVLATLLLLVFCIKLGWIPVWSAESNNYVLPVISLSVYPMAYITRLTKTSMLDALGQDYVRTAKAKGVSPKKVIFKHALRNALIPVLTYVGPMIAFIITGSLVVENIFTIGGLGSKFVSGITNRDYPIIMATTMFLAVLMIVFNLLTDIIYKVVDPRITFE